MASMRVHELAKEFDMTSKELLDRLHEMKIPAKSHASMLADAYVEKVRKSLSPEIKQRAGKIDAEEAKQLAEEKAEQKRKKAEEEAERRAAVEKERAEREAERARRSGVSEGERKGENVKHALKKAPVSSGFEGLASQIESEKERVAREKAEARAKARAAKMAAEVAKKQAVEEALRSRGKKSSKSQPQHKGPAPVLTSKKSSNFSSLLSQIESEKQRIEAQKADQTNKPKPERAGRGAKGERGPKKGKRNHIEQVVPELENQTQNQGEDRYAQMAVQAEKLQRDKVLAEARAAVAAANSHEGEGRRKKRKEKRQAEARERMEMEAIPRSCSTTPWSRFPRALPLPSSPSCSACSPTTSSSACSCSVRF